MNKIIRESEYFLAWLVFWLCVTVGGFILGVILGAILGITLAATGTEPEVIKIVGRIAGFIMSIPLSYLFFRLIVGAMIVKNIERSLVENTQGSI